MEDAQSNPISFDALRNVRLLLTSYNVNANLPRK